MTDASNQERFKKIAIKIYEQILCRRYGSKRNDKIRVENIIETLKGNMKFRNVKNNEVNQ